MRRLVIPLLIVGFAQWMAIGWWRFVDGVSADVSLGVIFQQSLGDRLRNDWEPAQRVVDALQGMSPGSLCLILAGYLILRESIVKSIAVVSRQRFIKGIARALTGGDAAVPRQETGGRSPPSYPR
jgi:hypothetical protein